MRLMSLNEKSVKIAGKTYYSYKLLIVEWAILADKYTLYV